MSSRLHHRRKDPGTMHALDGPSSGGARRQKFLAQIWLMGMLSLLLANCKKNDLHALLNGYEQTNLVSDTMGFGAAIIDPNLVNSWGLAVAPSGPIWIADNGTGLSTIYNMNGGTVRPPVTIPSPDSPAGGTPSGAIFNSTADFMIVNGKEMIPSRFIFATEDGTIAAWGAGNSAVIAANRSSFGAVYKGIALAANGGNNFLYATNFHDGTIDVFDKDFHLVPGGGFIDPGIPMGFAPFNIRNFGGWLYVTYAKQKPGKHDDMAGPGNGFVDIYKPNGDLVRRFATQGTLNSPWGMEQAKAEFVDKDDSAMVVLVGNFGDGTINVFNKLGIFLGQLKDHGKPVVIDGLWALEDNVPLADPEKLFFTAGPDGETHGLFGFLEKRHQ